MNSTISLEKDAVFRSQLGQVGCDCWHPRGCGDRCPRDRHLALGRGDGVLADLGQIAQPAEQEAVQQRECPDGDRGRVCGRNQPRTDRFDHHLIAPHRAAAMIKAPVF